MRNNRLYVVFFVLAVLVVFLPFTFAAGEKEQKITLPQALRGVTCYNNLTEDNFKELKSWNVNVIRLMVMYPDLIDWQTGQLLEEKFKVLVRILGLCKEYKIGCILDIHEVPGIVRWAKKFEKSDEFWLSFDYHQKFLTAWENLAKRLSGFGPELLAYQLVNEPEPHRSIDNVPGQKEKIAAELKEHLPPDIGKETFDKILGYVLNLHYNRAGEPSDWWLLAQRTITTIRKYDMRRPIIFDIPDSWNPHCFRSMKRFGYHLPITDPAENLAVSFHVYYPLKYFWTNMDDPVKAPEVTYPGEFQDWTGTPFDQVKVWNREALSQGLAEAREFAKANPNIRLLVTEFSVRRNAVGAAQFLRDFIELFEAEGWGWMYHTYNESGSTAEPETSSEKCYWELEVGSKDRLEVFQEFWGKNSR